MRKAKKKLSPHAHPLPAKWTWTMLGDIISMSDENGKHLIHCYGGDIKEPMRSRIAGMLELVSALLNLLDVCPCEKGCKPSDMTCATMRAKAAIRKAKW